MMFSHVTRDVAQRTIYNRWNGAIPANGVAHSAGLYAAMVEFA